MGGAALSRAAPVSFRNWYCPPRVPPQNVNIWRTGEDIMRAELESWDRVLKKLNKDPFFKKVVDSQKVWSQRVAFYDIVNAADYKLAYEHYFPGALPF